MTITFTKAYNEMEHKLYMTGILSYQGEDSYITIVTQFGHRVGVAFILNPPSPTPVLRWGSNAVFQDDLSTYACYWSTIGEVVEDFAAPKLFLPQSFDDSCHGLYLPTTNPHGKFVAKQDEESVPSQLNLNSKYRAHFDRFAREMLRQHQWLDCSMSGHIQCPQIQIGGVDEK